MNVEILTWVALMLALLLANLPFLLQGSLPLGPWQRHLRRPDGSKRFGLELLELVAGYLLWLGVARWLESRLGPVQPQHWGFYAVTIALFVVSAFPGYCSRYFWAKPGW